MPVQIQNFKLDRIGIIDDDDEVRKAYQYSLEDMDLTPVLENGPLSTSFKELFETATWDALICDHHLKTRQYATFNGAELVAQAYKRFRPSILSTRFQDCWLEIRPYREFIPVLFNPDDVYDLDRLIRGFEVCTGEFSNKFLDSRKPRRTLIRVEDVEERSSGILANFIVTGWDLHKVISIGMEHLPKPVSDVIVPGKRLHAKVNIGAERHEELYFKDWEID